MIVEVGAVIELEKDVLAESVDTEDFASQERVGVFGKDGEDGFVVRLDGFDGFARERVVETGSGAFDFGTFRHDVIYTDI